MNLQLEHKTALVTGSSSGIGEAIAKVLAAEGAHVVVHGRREQQAARVAAEIAAAGGRATVALGDLARDEDAARVADTALAALDGRVDILVNNAGAFPLRDWWHSAPAGWGELFNENVGGMVRLIQRLVPGMRERGWGRVINLSSALGASPMAAQPDYAAGKAAVVNLSLSLSKELAGSGVTVNTVSPGVIVTPGLQEAFRGIAAMQGWGEGQAWSAIEERAVATMLPQLGVRRFGRPEEIADAVAFLVSPRAGYLTGTNLRVDGGFVGAVN